MSRKKNKQYKRQRNVKGNNRQDLIDALERAVRHYHAGDLQQAEKVSHSVLEHDSDNADALHILGVIAYQRGNYDIAFDLVNKAVAKNASNPTYYNTIGNVLKDQGRLDEAIECFRKVVCLKPDFAGGHFNLGNVLKNQGRVDEAMECYQKAISLKPDYSEAYYNLGVVFKDQGRLDEATECFRKALSLIQNFPEAYNNLGAVFKEQGRLDEATEYFQNAISLKPDYHEAHNNLGVVFKDQGRLDEATECLQKALRLKPDYHEAHNNLGIVFKDQGRLSEATKCLQKAISLKPDYAEAYSNLGAVLKDQGRLDEAMECYQKALQLKPDLSFVHSNLLMGLHYRDPIDPVELFSQHKRWAEQDASPFVTTIKPHLNDRSPDRCLRLGYVSPDFRAHSVAYFIETPVASHDRGAFEIICYSDVVCPDSMTNRLKGLAGCWRDIVGMSDEQVADLIRNDEIDILVDLAGHTAKNRMLLFARKPAPIQVTYLGYPNTTGLPTMDYRITDNWADPAGQTDHLHTEELTRLPKSFLCYQPPEETPEVSNSPALNTGYVTFGSFNNRTKVTPETVKIWSAILKSVSNSRLILKSKALNDEGTRQTLWEMFSKNGVVPERIELAGHLPFEQHLQLYNCIDIGLDTFPYNGTTTTCEAMWMGVPVIALAGETHVSRVGVSLLMNAGLPELIAESAEEYVEKAVQLACDLKRLQAIRANLRSMMAHSFLMGAQGFTRSLEAAYRQMWRRWCSQV